MIAAIAVFFALTAARSWSFFRFLLASPSAFDTRSLKLFLGFGAWPLLLALGAWSSAFGAGRRALRALGAAPRTLLEDAAAAALGLGLFGTAVFLLGEAGGLSPAPLTALTVVAAAVGATELRLARPAVPRLGQWAGAAAGLLAFAAFTAAMTALAPPIEWDVRAYHLALPEIYLRAGRVVEIPWMIHSHWPHLLETLYAAPLAAGRDGAAALIHLGAAGLLVAGVFAAAEENGGPAAAWTAALLLAAQPALLREAGTAHADAYTSLCALAAGASLAGWERKRGDGALLAAGALAGLCAASKLTGLAALAAWTLWLAWRTRGVRTPALFAAAGLLLAGPWLLKSWLATGDPAWPLFAGTLGLKAGAAFAARFIGSNRWTAPPPWLLTHDGPLFLLAPLAGLLALSRGRRSESSGVERLLFAAAPFYVLLAFRRNEGWRYMMPVWAAFALAAGRAAAAAFAAGGARRAAAAVLVAAGALPIAAAAPNNELFAVLAPRPTAAPDADRRAYWTDRSLRGLPGFYRDARLALPAGAKVLLWREVRGYGAGFDYQWGDPANQDLIDYASMPGPDALYARLKALGVTHVFDDSHSTLHREDPAYYDARTLALMAECLRRRGRVALSRGTFALYELL
ncbi:MAG: hypothetical protein ACHQ49_04695 [Elusimicrobiota bacterium]